jgi:hypothetical protein
MLLLTGLTSCAEGELELTPEMEEFIEEQLAGLKGEQGEAGSQGIRGVQGEQGLQGVAGAKGSTGAKGATGATGPAGEQGEQGERGPGGAGSKGATGATGPQGPAGEDGEDYDPQALLDLQALIAALEERVAALELVPFVPPTIDGVIGAGEWDGATNFGLAKDGVSTYTAYVTNDSEFMYVAFDYVTFNGWVSFNTYKESTFVPETINAPTVASYSPCWDKIEADEFGEFTFDGWSREDPTTRYTYAEDTATEMKVPLAELGLAPGDTIKAMFMVHESPNSYLYPAEDADAFDPNTYATITLD